MAMSEKAMALARAHDILRNAWRQAFAIGGKDAADIIARASKEVWAEYITERSKEDDYGKRIQ